MSHVFDPIVECLLSSRPLLLQQIGKRGPQSPLRKPDLVFSITAYKETLFPKMNLFCLYLFVFARMRSDSPKTSKTPELMGRLNSCGCHKPQQVMRLVWI